jgi:hypothetical protein
MKSRVPSTTSLATLLAGILALCLLSQSACSLEPDSPLHDPTAASHTSPAWSGDPDAVAGAAGQDELDAAQALYRHPLQHRDARLLYAASKDAHPGLRHGVEEGQAEDETGHRVLVSGIRAFERRAISAAELAELAREKERLHGPRPAPQPGSALGPLLTELVEHHEAGRLSASADSRIEVVIALERSARAGDVPIFEQVEQAIAQGRVVTRADREGVYAEAMAARQAAIARVQAPVASAVERAGGTVLVRARTMHFVVALVPLSAVRGLAARADVARVDLHTSDDDEVHGGDVIKGHQIEQFITAGYDGENEGNPYDITFAQVEGGGAHNEHLGFREGTGTATRIRGMYSCSLGCVSKSDFASGEETGHASSVAGIIFGDLRDGQDSSVSTTADRVARSGYSGESRGWLYAGSSSVAFDHIAGRSGGTAPAVINMSAGAAQADPACQGRDTRSRAANEMFESGKLLIKSAGNEDHESTTDCRVSSPGSAIGALSIASIGSSSTGTESTVRGATISSFSSRGGTSSEGGGRTIIDLAAYGYRKNLFDNLGGYSRSGGGTSYAAPTVTALALDFIDHYKHEYSNLIDNPGLLAANMLLMGDRLTQSGSKALYGYDNLYGAGRLRARRYDSGGMDAPWRYSNGWVCIDNKESYVLTINNGAALSGDVDTFKAVLWWYDSRHQSNGTVDDIDLRLQTTAGVTLRSSLSLDNKERVFYQGIGGTAIQLQIYGYNVTSSDTGCGANSMKVYYAYFYEDSDRDDVDGPGTEVDPD